MTADAPAPEAPVPIGESPAGDGRAVLEVAADRETVLHAVGEAAEAWGAEWHRSGTSGRVALPVQAGVRHGFVEGALTATETGRGTRLQLLAERSDYRVHGSSVMILVFGALGALLTVVVPLFPDLIGLVPVGLFLMIGAWLLVAARVRHKSAREFLEMVRDIAEAASEEPPGELAVEGLRDEGLPDTDGGSAS